MAWLKLTDYAKQYGVTQSAIYSAIAAGRLRDNGKRGRERRVDDETDIRSRQHNRDEFALKMAEAKLRKMEGETRILEQRSERWRRMVIEETAEKFLRAFEEAFGPFRGMLVELKLGATALRKLQESFGECLSDFRGELERELEREEDDESD